MNMKCNRRLRLYNFIKLCIFVILSLITWKVITNIKISEDETRRYVGYENIISTTLPNTNLLRFNTGTPNYQYHCPFSASLKGKPFHPDEENLKHLGFPLKEYVVLSNATFTDFVFVTAASELYVTGLYGAIESIQKHFPAKEIIVFDLGMEEESLKKVSSLCRVTVKDFKFEYYPRHIEDLFLYSWKPLLIHEVLKQYSGVFWLDSSVRITTGNLNAIYNDVKRTDGILLFSNTGHSNYAVTHSQMYHYLPSRMSELQHTEQREANSILIYRTRKIYTGIISWWTLCALERRCMCPTQNRFCHFVDNEMWNKYADCHRFDQSALNVLLANYFNFDASIYKSTSEILVLKRGIYKGDEIETYNPKNCSSDGKIKASHGSAIE